MAAHDAPDDGRRPHGRPIEAGDADLGRVLKQVPRGALALCSLAVAVLMICWLAIYFGVFLPRGPVS